MNALSGGARLQAKLAELSQQVSKKAELRVGFLENAKPYPGGMNPASVAAIQEYGAPKAGIPPRPFFRTMIAENADRWGEQVGKLLVAHEYNVDVSMSLMGDRIADQLEQSIVNTNAPPLSDVTLLLRERFGSRQHEITGADVYQAKRDVAAGVQPNVTGTQAKPLVWTGHLLNSVDYEVRS